MQCSVCEQDFEPKLGQVYCSEQCRLKAKKTRRRAKVDKRFTCEQCWRTFWRNGDRGAKFRFCSAKCVGESRKKQEIEQVSILHSKVCAGCGKNFATSNPNQKYCTTTCSLERTCKKCSKSFTVPPNARLKERKYCSKACWQASMGGTSSLVYMLKSGPYIKLGFTSQPTLNHRLHQIQNAIPDEIEVLAVRPGTFEDEQNLHQGAIEWRHPRRPRSDWYVDCPTLREYVARFFSPDEGDPFGTQSMGCTDEPQSIEGGRSVSERD